MKMKTDIANSILTLCPNGPLDRHTSADFRLATKALDYTAVSEMVCDFRSVSYVSAEGARELLILRKKVPDKVPMRIINASQETMTVLDTMGLTSILDIQPVEDNNTEQTIAKNPKHTDSQLIDLSFRDFLEQKAAEMPHKIFLSGAESYTYEEIEKCAEIAASDLYALGVRKGSHVALCDVNSPNWIITFFAIQKLGAVALLVNPNLTEREIIALSRISDIQFFCGGEMSHAADNRFLFDRLLSDERSTIGKTYDISKRRCFKERLGEYGRIKRRCPVAVEADDPAVMMFTSGSTGQPKGVLHSSLSLLNASYSNMMSVQMTAEDRPCLILPLFHIFGLITVLFAAMLADATLFLPENTRTKTILSALEDEKCTALNAVPTMMLAIVNNKAFDSAKMDSLRVCTLAGSIISEAQMNMLQRKFPKTHFVISYGLSELAPATVTDYHDTLEHIARTVGRPVKDIEVSVSHPSDGDPVGEILLRGYSLMSGYYKLNIQEQAIDAEGWLHTGDLGFLDEDGYLHINGRLKELIIRGGENISPNQVAAAISEHDAIADVKVFGVPDSFYGENIAAAIILKKDRCVSEEELRAFLKGKIAKYKIPAYFVTYGAFPLLSNGKIDAINLRKDVIRKLEILV